MEVSIKIRVKITTNGLKKKIQKIKITQSNFKERLKIFEQNAYFY